LLAILADADPQLAELLARHRVEHAAVRDAVLAALSRGAMLKPDEFVPVVVVREGPPGARWDTPAVGVPRRFGVGILLLMTTMFAALFSLMRLLGAGAEVFIMVAVLFAGVGLGQMLLYGGKYPRAASIWVGGCLFPVEVIGLMIHLGSFHAELVLLLMMSPFLGAGFGYLAGGLTAGVFLLLKKYSQQAKPQPQSEEPTGSDV